MKSIQFKRGLSVAILGLSAMLGVITMPSVTTQAQSRNDPYYGQGDNRDRDRDQDDRDYGRRRRGRNWDRYGRWGGSYELRQTALNAGYNEGIKEGRKDRSKGR